MKQLGFLDFDIRLSRIDKAGDPLVKLDNTVNWEIFRPILEEVRHKPHKNNVGPRGYDAVLLFKILILQSLYNLADEALEFQILDRYSFSRFLGLHAASKVPDATTIWRFREDLAKAGKVEELFRTFDEFLRDNGFEARKGQIIDASIVRIPVQRNTREENKEIKKGNIPKKWSAKKRSQKDTDARWTKKNDVKSYGYKNHIEIDVKYKFIREYEVTDASVHDSNIFEELLDPTNTSADVYADSAYRSRKSLQLLREYNYREHLQRKGCRSHKLSDREKQGNNTRSRVRSRVEHIFGVMAQKTKRTVLRGIGYLRIKGKIGLRNLAFNIDRYGTLCPSHG